MPWLARALAQEADLLLLDEPLNAVDAATRQVVAEVLGALHQQGKTIITATHDLERLETDFDNALYLVDGHAAQLDGAGGRDTHAHPIMIAPRSTATLTGETYGLAD